MPLTTSPPRAASSPPATARRDPLVWATVLGVVIALGARLPYLTLPATPDEGGFLLVGSQWHPGDSLYGDHWVDRPPVLIAVHALAAALGGTIALRVIGLVAAVAVVLLAARLTRLAVPRPAPGGTVIRIFPVLLAAYLVGSPLFGVSQVPGELLTAPVVLAGVLAVIRGRTTPGRAGLAHMAWAGALAVLAAGMKQNAVDVAVVAATVLIVAAVAGRPRRALTLAVSFVAAAATTLGVVLALSALRGTTPAELWDAVVDFRVEASEVIATSSTGASAARARNLLNALLVSGVPVLVAMLLWRVRRRIHGRVRRVTEATRCPDLRWAAFALLAWEIVGITAGGSYWLHYLLLLVPGSVLLAVASTQRSPTVKAERALAVGLAIAAVSFTITHTVADGTGPGRDGDVATIDYLRENRSPGDTGTVAFGHPNILWEAGLDSPYRELWSLPVRVRDADLSDFTAVLRSSEAPTWVVVSGASLQTWGVDADRAGPVLRERYREVAVEGTWHIWRLRTP